MEDTARPHPRTRTPSPPLISAKRKPRAAPSPEHRRPPLCACVHGLESWLGDGASHSSGNAFIE